MERILEYYISQEDGGKSIKDFLQEQGFSRQNLVELKKIPESILLNGVWEYVTCKLTKGDMLRIQIKEEDSSEKIPPVELPFPIIFEDEDIVVINKPANMPIHPSLNNYENTLGNAAAYYFMQQGQPFVFRCINRLDRDTTGLTILAKHMVSCSMLQSDMVERRISREYLAIVEGVFENTEGTIDAPIGRKEGSTIERIIDHENGERAVTHYRVLEQKESVAMLVLKLETGRTHQIRVHMTSIGHPLVGDFLYNPQNKDLSRQALHAWKLSFRHPITKKTLKLEAPVPDDMKTFWQLQL